MDLSPSDWKYVDERADNSFVGREWVFARVRDFLSGPPGTFLLRGDPGTGKTAFAARIAQASCGRIGTASPPAQWPVAGGTISAAVFCRAGKTSVPEMIKNLSRQLVESTDGFAGSFLATRPEISAEQAIPALNVNIKTGDVHAGARVTGADIDIVVEINALSDDDDKAFSAGLAAPLRYLRNRGMMQPIVLLVDAVDEAASPAKANTFSRLLSTLDGVHLIVTCRPHPPVLADFRDAEPKVDLVLDTPHNNEDVHKYVRNRLRGDGSEGVISALTDRIAAEAAGNFLYAFYVTGTLIRARSLAGMDEKAARGLPLPTGGLPGVYEDFLHRQIAGDETRWAEELSPVLAPLSVALGDGFTTAQLKAIASRLTGQVFPLAKARQVTRLAGQFLDGPIPDGPFRVYHQSFSRFLADPEQNPNWPIDLAETNDAVVRALMPEGQPGTRDWAAAPAYVYRHLATHAAAAGILDDLLLDHDYLLVAHPSGLLAVMSEVRSQDARRASAAYRRVAHRLTDPSEPARDSYLQLAALQVGAETLCTTRGMDTSHDVEAPRWWPTWAWWRPATAARVVGELPSAAVALAALMTKQGPLAVAGGEFGLEVWDIDSGQRLATHPLKVLSVAAGQADGRPVVLAGHGDGIVTLHELPSLQVLARNESAHKDRVLATAVLGRGSIAATGDEDGALVLWRLPALETLATRPNAHTMVRALAAAVLGGTPLLISVGDTLNKQGYRNPDSGPVRAWTLPGLHLHSEIETAVNVSWVVAAASTPLGCIIVFQRGLGTQVHLIATDGALKLIGTPSIDCDDLLVLEEGDEPRIMVCGATMVPLRISLRPVPVLTPGSPLETEQGAKWDGPIDLRGQPFAVSATDTLRVWELDELLDTSPQQGDLSQRRAKYHVIALSAAADVLAALTEDGSVHRWHWRSAEPMEPMAVRPEEIKTLASCVLVGRPHFVVAYGDGIVEAFDAKSGERWPARLEVAAPLQSMAVGEHGGRTVAVTAVQLGLKTDSTWPEGRPFYGVRLWDLTTGIEISTRLADKILRNIPNADSQSFTWNLTVRGYADKELRNLVAVEAGDDLLIAAYTSRMLIIWPLNDISSATYEGQEHSTDKSISAFAGRRGLLATGDRDGWELWHLNNRADRKSRADHPGVTALAFGSWQGAPALLSGSWDGWLRVWSQNGAQILAVDIDEHITSLVFLPDDGIAVGTGRGIVILRLTGADMPQSQGPLEVKVAALRTAVQQQREFFWTWRDWRRGIIPPATVESYSGPVREIVELIAEFPAETFRTLSSWLEDETPLAAAEESKVADVACALMAAYAHVVFDDLCEVLADADDTAGTESQNPFRLLQDIMTAAPEAGTSVCERWSTKSAKRAQLSSACARSILWADPPPELRARLLAVEIRILSSNPTPLARTEALHVLATWPETRDLVINDLVDRLLGRAEGYVDTIILSKAFATHFDRLIDAFEQKLMRNPSSYDYHELSALADYIPATDAEAERILGLFERLWDAGPGEPITTIAENLLKFSARVQSTRDRAVTLAFRIAQSSGSRHAYGPLAQAAIDNRDPGFRQQIFEVFTESDDPKMKEALISELVREVGGFADPDETLYEAVLRAAATGLEANEIGLVFAAQRSREFALALARVIRHTTPKPGGLLATFADQTTSQPDPQSAARRAIELHRKKRD